MTGRAENPGALSLSLTDYRLFYQRIFWEITQFGLDQHPEITHLQGHLSLFGKTKCNKSLMICSNLFTSSEPAIER